MRLIDADKLIQYLTVDGYIPNVVVQAIENQPTAYDVDKVIEQLEEFRPEMNKFGCGGILTDIIEVVKGGGVNA